MMIKEFNLRLDTYPTIPVPQCCGALQKNQTAVAIIKYMLKRKGKAMGMLTYVPDHL
jgi:hypothetical protein